MGLYVDCHCHLDHPKLYKDLDAVIGRARLAGVSSIISNGVDPRTNRITLKMSELYPEIRPALGIYPIDALQSELMMSNPSFAKDSKEKVPQTQQMPEQAFDVDEELDFIRSKRRSIIALGEVGLDYKMSVKASEHRIQRDIFQKVIDLSEKINKPMIVHTRKAEADCIAMLETSKNKRVILHCFSGKFNLVRRAADNGWYFTIPTNVTKSNHFQKIAQEINISQLLTETDAPYLSPYEEVINEPAFVVESARKIALLKGLEEIEVVNNIYMNYQKIFVL